MAYFHTTVLDEQIKALPTVDTASGSVATFDTDMTENLIEVVCDIQYSQASGTPTPDNPLPITTYTSLNLSHSGADTSNPNITNIPFGQTVAKGTLNVTTGVLEITHGVVTFNNMGFTYNAQGFFDSYKSTIGAKTNTTALLICSCYAYASTTPYPDLSIYQSTNRIRIRDDNYNDVTSWLSAVGNNQVVFELETPITIQLSSTQITALLNENNIWCDTNGDTEVKYILSVGKTIS